MVDFEVVVIMLFFFSFRLCCNTKTGYRVSALQAIWNFTWMMQNLQNVNEQLREQD